MVRSYTKYIKIAMLLMAGMALFSVSCSALTLLAPTEGQNVRENVKIAIPASAMPGRNAIPPNPFIAVMVGEPGAEKFVAALDPQSAIEKNGMLIFYWNSKSTYHDPQDQKKELNFKDGKYSMIVQIHDASSIKLDSATVTINLKNKVDRTNPAPAVKLINSLSFGQTNTYDIRSDVNVYDSLGLPILGGLGISGDFKIIQSVEDARPDGQYMVRCRVDDGAYVSSYGNKTILYKGDEFKPQLYSLVTRSGKVVVHNMFSKQGKFTMMDVLPVLPGVSVKEGDTWPAAFNIKLDGLVEVARLTGTSMLDSFEWQDNQSCAKIISRLSGNARISLLGGKIHSLGSTMNAEVVTYFSYKTGKMIKSEIKLDVPAFIEANAGEAGDTGNAGTTSVSYPGSYYDEDEDSGGAPANPSVTTTIVTKRGASRNKVSNANKGTVQITAIVRLEK